MYEQKPLLSVIIPVYNGEKTIKRAVESIVNQPMYSKVEIIIVDDGSTDSTPAIISRLSQKHERIKCIHKQNGGASSARNVGISVSEGEYLNFTDADDWWNNGFFDNDICEKLYKGTDIICFSRAHISPNYNYIENELLKADYIEFANRGADHYHMEPPTCNMYHNLLLKKNKLKYDEEVTYFEDLIFCFKIFSCAKSIEHSDKLMYMYWMNPRSQQHTYDSFTQFEHAWEKYGILKNWYSLHDIEYKIPAREQLSLIVFYLSMWCSDYSWNKVETIVRDPRIAPILSNKELRPWRYLEKRYMCWRLNHRVFYYMCKIHPGIYNIARKRYFSKNANNKLVEWVLYRIIKRWDKFEYTPIFSS